MKPPRKVVKNGQERWFVDLREFGSGRKFCATEKEATRALARAVADRDNFGRIAADMPYEQRVRYLAQERRLFDLGATIEQAVDWFIETHRPAAIKPILAASNECLVAKEASGCRPRYLEQFRYSLASLVASIGDETPCSEVTREQVESWLANPKWSARTRKGRWIDARTLFSFAIKRGWCLSDPCANIEPIRLDEKPPGILSVEQVAKVMSVCRAHRPHQLPWFVLGIFAGIRPNEMLALTWRQVDLAGGYVEIPSAIAKGRRRRLVKLQPNAISWLRLGGRIPPENWKRDWNFVRRKAGFALGRTAKRNPWLHDAMRHSFCSYALPMFGASATAEWAGHSETMLFRHYRELVTREDAERFWSIRPE